LSPADFAAAVASYDLRELPLDVPHLPEAPILVVGEPHGADQTACVVWTLLGRLGYDRLALEWPEDELAPIACDPALVESLAPGAETRSGEGRFAAGLFKLVASLPRPPLLLDLSGDRGGSRTDWLRERLEALRSRDERTLALLGAQHAAALHAHGFPALILEYDGGAVTHHGVQDLIPPTLPPDVPRLRLGPALPAAVAG
jgi:hypothetical protein